MPLSEGWRDQYARMLRSHKRLKNAAGPSSVGSDEARDALYHFFQDAYHLKDWIKNDAALTRTEKDGVEGLFSTVPPMQITADLCNGIKHLKLKRTRTGDLGTTLASQSVTIWTAAARPLGQHFWEYTSNGRRGDVLQLADDVVAEWQSWLRGKGLL